MKKILLATTSLVVLSAASGAHAGGSNEPYTTRNTYKTNAAATNNYQPADEAWYVSVSGLADWTRDQGPSSFNTGWGVLAAVGEELNWGFAKGMRGELELGYRTADADPSGSLSAYTGFANVYYDFKNNSAWTPYVGAGIGAAYLDADNLALGTADDNGWAFAYQGIAGVNYAFTRNWSAQVEYRYVGSTDADLSSGAGPSADYALDSHNVVAGLKYKFY